MASGRIPYASDPRRRLDPVRIREVNEGYLFQDLVAQLMGGLFSGIPGSRIVWSGLPVGPGGGASTVEMDWATWLSRAFEYNDTPTGVFIDVESTVRSLDDGESGTEYVAQKILNFKRLLDAPGGIPKAIKAAKSDAKYSAFPSLTDPPLNFLIFVSNRAEKLPDVAGLRAALRGTRNSLVGTDPRIDCTEHGHDGSAIAVDLPGGNQILVGLMDREKLLEFAYLAQALNEAKRHDLVNERFLHELTALAGHPVLLEPMPRKIEVKGAAPPTPVQVDGRPATFYRFSVDPFAFLRMSTVLRLVSDYAFLQRLPEGGHLGDMALDVEAGGRFPTPVLCIPAAENKVNTKQSFIYHAGGAIVSPYEWHIIDGQHRAFSYYLVSPGAPNIQDLDINCYELASPSDRGTIASGLFLNVNYKAMKPPIDLALAHYAYSTAWPGGNWVIRKRGRGTVGDSQLYSARILASRFLLEMSTHDTVFRQFFKYRGAKDKGKTSIQSISTYLSPDFDLRDPADPDSPFAARFGNVKGASGAWTVPDPAPEHLGEFWKVLVDSFDEFLTLVLKGSGKSTIDAGIELRELVSRNNNVFVALWRAFYWYSFERVPGTGPVPVIPKTTAAKIMPWLYKQDAAGRLSGPDNKYRSGAGAIALSKKLIDLIGS